MLTREEVIRIANLARISLTEEEIVKFGKDLTGILNYIETLNKADTSGVEPLYQTSGIVSAMRPDEADKGIESDKRLLLDQAPDQEDGYLKVESIISK